ncbi:translocation/assembly module TamB domain-containing protein [Chitinophaga cymbidii]|uniref:translocation/assembly module TamB domain-containing protein n=1 Tax=Chitinophaga cymbidii TaxID=1096750 RepID=UPI0011BDC03E|nr:translocation/assembly module TamB [Chitinophaga cymbidii]
MSAPRRKKIVRWIVGSLLTLLLLPILLLLLLQLPVVQHFVRNKAESYLRDQLKTDVRIGGLRITWFNAIRLDDVFVGDTRKDTLLSSRELSVRYNLFSLFGNELNVRSLTWEDAVVNIYRPANDSAFNYQFVIDAFSSPSAEEDTLIEESGTTLKYNIGNVALERITVRFNDTLGGMLASVRLQQLEVTPDELQPEYGTYHLRNFLLDGLQASIQQLYRPAPEEEEPADTSATPLDLYARELVIRNSQWSYSDEAGGLSNEGRIGTLELKKAQFDLLRTLVTADALVLKQSATSLDFRRGLDTVTVVEDTLDSAPNTWRVTAKTLQVDELDFAMNDHLTPRIRYANALDYSHLNIQKLVLDAEDISYNADSALATIHKGSMREQSGLVLQQLEGKVLYTNQEAKLSGLLLQTADSRIDADVYLQTESWSTLSDQLPLLKIDADVRPSTLVMEEALFFIPDMRNDTALQPLWKKRIALHGKLGGSLAQLSIPGIEIKDNDQNYLYVKGTAYQVTDPDRMGADLVTLKILSSDRGVRSWLPANTLPASMQLPNRLAVNGSIRGGMQLLRPDLRLNTELGNASLKGELEHFMDMQKIRYNAALNIDGLQVGRLLGDTTMGSLTGNVTANGKGTDPNTAAAKASIGIQSFTYNRYTYRDIKMDASLANSAYAAKGSINDTSAKARFDISGKLDSLNPAIVAKADLDRLDLYATNFTTSPMTVRTCLDAELDNLAPRKLSGYAAIHKIQLMDDKEMYVMDSILFKAAVDEGLQKVSLVGPFGYIAATGDFNYQTFAAAAGDLVTRHLEAEGAPPSMANTESQWLQFSGSLSIPKSLRKLLPDIELPKPLTMEGRLQTDSSLLSARFALPHIRVDSFEVDTLLVDVSADTSQMEANILLGRLHHPQLPLQRTTVDVSAKAGTLDWGLVMGEQNEKPKYSLGGLVSFLQNDSLLISLKKELVLNRQTWSAAGDNRLLIQNGGVAFADIGIQKGPQELKITSSPPAQSSPLPDLTVSLKDFRLSTVTSLIEKDTALAEGISNGSITVTNLAQTPLIDGKLNIDSLAVMGSKIGQLALTASTTAEKAVQLDATIQGNDNDVRLQGTYAEQLDFRLDIAKLNMQSIEAFTFGNVTSMSGHLTGNATVRGTTDQPVIRGSMHFEKVKGRVTAINSIVQLPSEDLTLDDRGVRFNNFVIADSSGNEAVLNGEILTRDLTAFQLNLNLDADNFQALGPATNDPDQFYYGPAYVDVRARIRGTMDLPRVEMNLKLREKSNVTVMIPEEEPGIASREGVIEFWDPAAPVIDTSFRVTDTAKSRSSGIKGFVFSGDIEVNPQSTLKLVIDQSNGDFLEVKGNATLNLTMDPSSKMSLTGRYEINEGKYAMSLSQLIKREFKIEKGSTIIWNGDPLSADVDITAKYDVNAVAADLVADQIKSTDQRRGRFNQKVPVEVFLKITGELMKPEIAFELDMPEKDQGLLDGMVYTRIKQINQVESELNKQVMGLLVLNRFISENPFDQLDTKATSGAEDMARRSVSKLVSQQLNNLAGSLIKGFDVNFDLQSSDAYTDEGSRQEATNLKVDVSKRLFNDRLTVSVGSNIGISGAQTQGQNASSVIGDVSAEYMLTPDGRYRLRAYQRNLTETVVQGQIVETGLTFMIIMDYNEFREIFGKTKKEKQQRLRQESK